MISSASNSKLSCLCAVVGLLVGSLCSLASPVKPGPVPANVTETEYGRPILPPKNVDSPYPRLLHERDVILYFNAQGQRVSVGSGTFANVTLGELAGSKVIVVVKSFRSSTFRDILKEVRLHRYAEQLGITPILIGLLPFGPLTGNISLVYEYIIYSKSLDDWLDDYRDLSTVQWLSVCHQLVVSLRRLHQHDVLFNDLHGGNVLIQKNGNTIRVFIIDFGFATYKSGKVYSHSYGNFSGYSFIAPELTNRLPSTIATDTFALGSLFYKIANKIKLLPLYHLAYWCLEVDPIDRPLLWTVIARLDTILFGANLQLFKHTRSRIRKVVSRDYVMHYTENLAAVSEINPICPSKSNFNLSKAISNSHDSETSEWAWLTQFGMFGRCRVPLFVLDEHDLAKQNEDEITWLSEANHDAIRLARLKLTNQTVIVKEFYQVPFEEIRDEACVTGFLGNLNVSPQILGILIEYRNMKDIALVQELYGQGVSLTEFISISSGHEWDLKFLKKLAIGYIEYGKGEKELLDTFMNCCEYSVPNAYIDILNGWRLSECKTKSYRRLILERISLDLIEKVKLIHDSGYLLNNCRTNNIIVKWSDNSKDRHGVDIRIIDLGLVSAIDQGIFFSSDTSYHSRFTYHAPEVVRGRRTSRSSDVYSLCFALYQTMKGYFQISALTQRSTFSLNRDCLDSRCTPQHESRFEVIEDDLSGLRDRATAFNKYHQLLLQCLHGRSSDRPDIRDLLAVSLVAFN